MFIFVLSLTLFFVALQGSVGEKRVYLINKSVLKVHSFNNEMYVFVTKVGFLTETRQLLIFVWCSIIFSQIFYLYLKKQTQLG